MPPIDRRCILGPALAAGGLAIAVNTLALKAADWIPLATARGGLLRLIRPWCGPILQASGVAAAWRRAGAPAPGSPAFQIGFHVAVGLAMALFYAFVLEPLLTGRPWLKGATYALAVWFLNAVVVLPATGEGFAGSAHLTLAGMVWFAGAHILFFVPLAILFAALRVGLRPGGA